MKPSQLRQLVKGIIVEMIANKNYPPEPMGAVNVEAASSNTPEHPWKEIDNGFFIVNSDFAKKLAGGKLPGPGYEKLVSAPKGFESKRGFVWLAQTIYHSNPAWSIRDAGNWKLVNGIGVLSSTDVMGSVNEMLGDAPPQIPPHRAEAKPKVPMIKQGPTRSLGVPEKHQLKIALQTLRAPDAMVGVMGGMNKDEARAFLKKIGYSDDQISRVENPEVMEQSATGAVAGYATPFAFKRKKVSEMTSTGAVAGYSTPYAFSGKGKGSKNGSKRALDVTTRMGFKKVKDISETEKPL